VTEGIREVEGHRRIVRLDERFYNRRFVLASGVHGRLVEFVIDSGQPEFLSDNIDVFFAVIGQVDYRVIADLKQFLNSNPKLHVQILACVYPASSTQEDTLAELLELTEQLRPRLEVNLLPIPSDGETSPFTTVASVNKDNSQYHFWFENANRLRTSDAIPGHVGMHIDADGAAFKMWLDRFVILRESAVPLTALTARVPRLVPARGSLEAAESWRAYLNSCRELAGSCLPPSINADDATEVTQERTQAAVERICHAAGIDPPDSLAPTLASILSKGHIVTIDKSSRTPPLELPVKAEWLGVESLRSVGLFSRETKYRLRIFDDKTHKDLNHRRNGVTTLLKRLSFPIADNLHWMPHAAKPLFQKEWKRLEHEAQAIIRGLIGNGAPTFAKHRRQAIEKDANQFYQEFHPNETIETETVSKIMAGLEDRLQSAGSGDYLPSVSYASISFVPGPESTHVSEWAQPRTLLVAIAKFVREAITDPYFFRGYRVSQEEIISAMNVAEDCLVPHFSDPHARALADDQLATIARIDADELMSDREKCEKLLSIIKSPPAELKANHQHSSQAALSTTENLP
jgi:hypothetical protein